MLQNPNWDKPKLDYSAGYRTLALAADYIEKHGWCQGVLAREEGVCIIGSIKSVASYEDGLLACHLFKQHCHTMSIAFWNDRICQSKEQAIRMLCEAATPG